MSPTTRRTVMMGAAMPFATIPDFAAPAPRAAPPDPDARLVELCLEHGRQWVIASSTTATDEEADAAVLATCALVDAIASTRATTALGLAHKARVTAVEGGFGRILDGRDLRPLEFDADKCAVSLFADLILGHCLTA